MTTVRDGVSTFVRVTLLDIFNETSGQFPASFMTTKLGVFNDISNPAGIIRQNMIFAES